jgi:hypothetical protein
LKFEVLTGSIVFVSYCHTVGYKTTTFEKMQVPSTSNFAKLSESFDAILKLKVAIHNLEESASKRDPTHEYVSLYRLQDEHLKKRNLELARASELLESLLDNCSAKFLQDWIVYLEEVKILDATKHFEVNFSRGTVYLTTLRAEIHSSKAKLASKVKLAKKEYRLAKLEPLILEIQARLDADDIEVDFESLASELDVLNEKKELLCAKINSLKHVRV